MNPFLIYIVSGWVFWPGVLLLLLGAGISFRAGKWRRRLAQLLVVFGLVHVLVSALPLPGWLLLLLFLFVIAFIVEQHLETDRKWMYLGVILLTLLAGILELPYWLDKKPLEVPGRVWVMGDSISAGIGFPGEVVWSDLVNRKHPGRVVNRSVGGGTISSSLSSLEKYELRAGDALVIEIGGNDLLVLSGRFREELDQLLAAVAATGAPAVMFELPLPPLANGFGRAQRQLARKYGITLIPRRHFSGILRGEESTADGLHLSNSGHEKMLESIERYIVFTEK